MINLSNKALKEINENNTRNIELIELDLGHNGHEEDPVLFLNALKDIGIDLRQIYFMRIICMCVNTQKYYLWIMYTYVNIYICIDMYCIIICNCLLMVRDIVIVERDRIWYVYIYIYIL